MTTEEIEVRIEALDKYMDDDGYLVNPVAIYRLHEGEYYSHPYIGDQAPRSPEVEDVVCTWKAGWHDTGWTYDAEWNPDGSRYDSSLTLRQNILLRMRKHLNTLL